METVVSQITNKTDVVHLLLSFRCFVCLFFLFIIYMYVLVESGCGAMVAKNDLWFICLTYLLLLSFFFLFYFFLYFWNFFFIQLFHSGVSVWYHKFMVFSFLKMKKKKLKFFFRFSSLFIYYFRIRHSKVDGYSIQHIECIPNRYEWLFSGLSHQ